MDDKIVFDGIEYKAVYIDLASCVGCEIEGNCTNVKCFDPNRIFKRLTDE